MDKLDPDNLITNDEGWTKQEELSKGLPHNFVEMTKLPKKIDAKSVVSLIASASKIVPIAVNICLRTDRYNQPEPAAIVEFKTEKDAFRAVDKIKLTAFGRRWQMRIIKNPEFTKTEAGIISDLIS